MSKVTYYWDEVTDNVSCEEDENGHFVASYQHQPGLYGELVSQERDGDVSYYHYDGQGNTLALADQDGAVTDTAAYTAYGETVEQTGSTVNPFGYGGAIGYYTNTDTADIYIRARTYISALGRWSSRDPIGYRGGENVYRYAKANPASYVDSSGKLAVSVRSGRFEDPKKGCGSFSMNWDIARQGQEQFVVQKLCIRASSVICNQKDGCCKGTKRIKPCKICFYELLIDSLRQGNNEIDEWALTHPKLPLFSCGSKGEFAFLSEIRAFNFVYPGGLGVVRGPKILRKCGRYEIKTNEESSEKEPAWWNRHSASVSTFAHLRWNCCSPNRDVTLRHSEDYHGDN